MAREYRQGMFRLTAAMRRGDAPLRLPPGTTILGVSPHVWFYGDDWGLKVEHPALPATPECFALPEVKPLFHADGTFDRWEIASKG